MTRVKICGITRVEDGLAAARLGAHAIGFVFWAKSPRNVDPARAAGMVRALPPFVCPTGVFVDPDTAHVEAILEAVPLGLLQFHGDEPESFCRSFGMPYLKAVRMREGLDLIQYAARYASAAGVLLDTFVAGTVGGTGTGFDWDLVPQNLGPPIVLSGGLHAGNVARAIRRLRPWAVDVSSGVEASPGIKDAARIAAFMQGVRDADV